MTRYPNLPHQQWRTQELIDPYNRDVQEWNERIHNVRRLLMKHSLIVPEVIEKKIFLIRGQKVMLSIDLAALYEVEHRALMQAVRRNRERFPEDFMFQLTPDEFEILKSHFVTSSWGGRTESPIQGTPEARMTASIMR